MKTCLDRKVFHGIIMLLIVVVPLLFMHADTFGAEKGLAPELQKPSPYNRTLDRYKAADLPDLSVKLKGPGGGFALTVTTFNNGTADAGSFKISFICEHWPEGEHQFKSKCSLPEINVTVGLGKGKTNTLKIPNTVAQFKKGYRYDIAVSVDKGNLVKEQNENNNSDWIGFTY